MTVNERIDALREEMKKEGIDFYLIPMADYHTSEYVGDYFKGVEYISGFTGTNATVVISQDEAGLWTDGRYFIQARMELDGTYVKLFEMGEEGVPTVEKYLEEHLKEHGVIGFDGKCIYEELAEKFQKIAEKKNGSLNTAYDLLDRFWTERPELPKTKLWVLEEKYAGESMDSKIAWLRGVMKEKEADAYLLTSLYDIAWLFNMRADDIKYVPVFMSYVWLTAEEIRLYVAEESLTEAVKAYLAENGVEVRAYDAIYQDLPEVSVKSVLYNPAVVNHSLVEALPKDVEKIEDVDPTDERKSVKNDTEIQNTIQAHIKDGVAVTKFIYWLKKNIGKIEMTEISAADYLEERRKEQEHFLDLSFETISAYGPNAAMMHYEPTPEKFSKLKPEGFLLVDSGAHYLEGTTDITRTIALGELTEKMKEYFTVTLRSNLRLAAAKFPEGTIGQNLDVLARGPVWDMGLDYRCGTGHGVGHILNVHEGPQSFRWRVMDRAKVWRLKPGMITTNEPGLYIEDEFGIRHENELLCREAEKTEYGQYYHFQVITYAPFDLDAIKPEMLTYLEKEELNRYHKMVYDTLSPYMTEEENAWLKEATRAI